MIYNIESTQPPLDVLYEWPLIRLPSLQGGRGHAAGPAGHLHREDGRGAGEADGGPQGAAGQGGPARRQGRLPRQAARLPLLQHDGVAGEDEFFMGHSLYYVLS